MEFRELDRQVTYAQQLGGDDGPIELVNVFTMEPGDVEEFLAVWAGDAAYMRAQPGFVRAQLYRGTAGSATFVNVAAWESAASLRAAFGSPAFAAALARYPDSVTASPHVVQRVAVPGVCAA